MTFKDMLQTVAKSPFMIGVIVVAVLLLLSWVVSVRLGGTDMPHAGGALGGFGTVSQLADDMGGSGTAGDAKKLPFLAPNMPPFSGIDAWLNSGPLTPEDLKGKVVLIDFWTYSCINCIRTLPYVTAWQKTYGGQDFTVIGVHTPEFAFEKEEANVRDAIRRFGITYPVALDNAYGTWNNYANHYWPAHYLFDSQGRLRYTHFGEGKYDETEADIRALIAEKHGDVADDMPRSNPEGADTTLDFTSIGTPETYVGYARQEHFGSPESVKRDAPQTYSAPAKAADNTFYLSGTWNVAEEQATAVNAGASIVYRYTASNANLVMGSGKAAAVEAEVTLDGKPVPASARGADVTERDGKTYVTVEEKRLYDLIDTQGDYGTHTLRIDFRGAGVEAYAFTFG